MKIRTLFYTAAILVSVAIIYFNTHTANFYSALGDKYYKHNNIEKAQEYYEKSFLLGNKNLVQREAYVNSLINTPLTIENQEKLKNIASDDIQDSANIKAQYFLYDMMREIHRKYPQNYINQAPQNNKIIRWGKNPIKYAFDNTTRISDDYIQEIELAFKTWEKQSDNTVQFVRSNPEESNILVCFIKNPKVENLKDGQKYVIAYTIPEIQGKLLKKMTIKVNTKDFEGKNYSNNQIYNTLLHEIFHALGFMGHSYNKNNIMFLAKDNDTLLNDLRENLTQSDIDTLKLLYKIKPDITNSDSVHGEYIPYLVIGNVQNISYNKTREAKNYISKAPTIPNGYIDLADSYITKKEYAKAAQALEKALERSDSADAKYIVYYNLGVTYFYMGNYEMALDSIEKALQINNTEELGLLLAEVYSKQGEINKSINEYTKLVSKNSNNIDYTVNLANLYLKKSNYLKARQALKHYINNNPQDKNNPKILQFGILRY